MTGTRRRRGHRKPSQELKDCLVQARVPKELQSALKNEARRRRLSVSHLVRNVLEDTVTLVDNVVAEVDNLVADSLDLAHQVSRDASHIATNAVGRRGRQSQEDGGGHGDAGRGEAAAAAATGGTDEGTKTAAAEGTSHEAPPQPDPLDHIYAWNPVVLNRIAACARCDASIEKGEQGHLGLTQDPTAAPTWLCGDCLDAL